MQGIDTPSFSESSMQSCFQSVAKAMNYNFQCTGKSLQSTSQNATNVLLGCLETSLNSWNRPSCSSSLFRSMDPKTLLSLYQDTTVVFGNEDVELCRNVQDQLHQMGLGTINVSRPEDAQFLFFSCEAYVHNVMFCCSWDNFLGRMTIGWLYEDRPRENDKIPPSRQVAIVEMTLRMSGVNRSTWFIPISWKCILRKSWTRYRNYTDECIIQKTSLLEELVQ